MMAHKQPIAVFDIDGTLFRWQLFHELVFELSKRGVLDKKSSQQIEQQFLRWRALKASWQDYESQVVDALYANIENISPQQLDNAAQAVLARSGHKVYNYTSNLVKKLKQQGYFLLAITGSQQAVAEPFAIRHGFDHCVGVIYTENPQTGKYTKNHEQNTIGHKAELLTDFIAKNYLTLKGSYAVGDSKSDAEMIAMVENPIAFNPDEELLKIATSKNWPVVIERKNIAYTLDFANKYQYQVF